MLPRVSFAHSKQTWRVLARRGNVLQANRLVGSMASLKEIRPSWSSLRQADKAAFDRMGEEFAEKFPPKQMLLQLLKSQQNMQFTSMPVNLYDHNLQTATLAERLYRSKGGIYESDLPDVVTMSLFHDVTENIGPKNHGGAAAAFLEPYLKPKYTWMLRYHELQQGHYYFGYYENGDKDTARKLLEKDHPEWFQALEEWCEHCDQAAFDPQFEYTLGVMDFEPYLQQVFSRRPYWYDETNPFKLAVTAQ